jgi:hypothetical protein
MTTADKVVDILVKEGGYRQLPQPMRVGSVSFQFAYALVAEKRANDIVVVIELKSETSDEIVIRNVLGLTRALDVLKSKRSVTAVLTSGQAAPETIRSISRVCRVLPIGAPSGPNAEEAVRDWLSVLLPLKAIGPAQAAVEWESALREQLHILGETRYLGRLIVAARAGEESVEQEFAAEIATLITPALREDEEEEF